jgi:3-hydroxyacyl-[acyl-carrier-protein] dehydratase
MPIVPIIDPADYIEREIAIPMDEVRTANPQRGDFEHLNGLYVCDLEQKLAVGVRHIPTDPFWAAGHIPGNPLLPGVLMLESLAQVCSYYFKIAMQPDPSRFFGWGGLDAVSFRGAVLPGETMIIAARNLEVRPRRAKFDTQGFVNGKCVVEAKVTGLIVQDPRWKSDDAAS